MGGWFGGKAAGIGVVLDAVEADRLGFDDECSEDTTAGRERPDGLGQFARDPDMDELDQGSVLADDPDGRIFCPGGFPCRLGRRCEQFGQVAGGGDGGRTGNQGRQPLGSYFGQASSVVRSPTLALSVSSRR